VNKPILSVIPTDEQLAQNVRARERRPPRIRTAPSAMHLGGAANWRAIRPASDSTGEQGIAAFMGRARIYRPPSC